MSLYSSTFNEIHTKIIMKQIPLKLFCHLPLQPDDTSCPTFPLMTFMVYFRPRSRTHARSPQQQWLPRTPTHQPSRRTHPNSSRSPWTPGPPRSHPLHPHPPWRPPARTWNLPAPWTCSVTWPCPRARTQSTW